MAQSIRNWAEQADLDEGRREDGLTTAERDELRRLRPENRTLTAMNSHRIYRSSWWWRLVIGSKNTSCKSR